MILEDNFNISMASLVRYFNSSLSPNFEAENKSNQYGVSSASSTTMHILENRSFLDLALQKALKFAPVDVPDLQSWDPNTLVVVLNGRDSTNWISLIANFFVRSQN